MHQQLCPVVMCWAFILVYFKQPDFMVRHNLLPLKTFLHDEKGYWRGKETNGREELRWSVLRAF